MTATMKYHPQPRPEDSFMDRGVHMEAEEAARQRGNFCGNCLSWLAAWEVI